MWSVVRWTLLRLFHHSGQDVFEGRLHLLQHLSGSEWCLWWTWCGHLRGRWFRLVGVGADDDGVQEVRPVVVVNGFDHEEEVDGDG